MSVCVVGEEWGSGSVDECVCVNACVNECVCPSVCDEGENVGWVWFGRLSSAWTLIGMWVFFKGVWDMWRERKMVWKRFVGKVVKVWKYCCVRGIEEEGERKENDWVNVELYGWV